MNRLLTAAGLILLSYTMAATATIVVPVDMGAPRTMRGDLFVTVPLSESIPVSGQTLSLDYVFSNFIHVPRTVHSGSYYIAIRAETNMVPQPGALYPSVSSSAYAVGLNGYQGPTLYLPPNTMLFGPNVTEILFGLVYPANQFVGPYLTGAHFDLTLPDIDGAEINALRLHFDMAVRPRDNRWQIMANVPDTGSTIALLAAGLLTLALFRRQRT
jgi:hypothetical protein